MLRRKARSASNDAAVRAALEARQAALAAVEAADAAETAVASAEMESEGADENTAAASPADRKRLSRRSVLAAMLSGLVLAGLLTTAGLFENAHRTSLEESDQDLIVLGSARQAVINLISPNAQDAAASADRIVNDATGDWLSEFQSTKDEFVSAIAQSKTESNGEILGAGLEGRNDDGSATILVAAVSKVTNAAGAQDEPRTWRLRVEVVAADGTYKLSKVEVVP
ncbi:hypothetical protein P3H15_47940 [Rhodococcus sp. T2V]|uniref:hypothetical protein n=1 Tax=Rhodococcus sp. T2V TaxID=3034164 RepID=UPI0023E29D51|nr:hypothetical protein [Rhodococcus sp. T2V]MDF3312680.1 hypothetical protein [Rhodococcus sp. T2V]